MWTNSSIRLDRSGMKYMKPIDRVHQKVPGPISTKDIVATSWSKDDRHRSLQCCQSLHCSHCSAARDWNNNRWSQSVHCAHFHSEDLLLLFLNVIKHQQLECTISHLLGWMWLTSKVEKGPPICWVKLSSTFHFQACFPGSEKMDFKLWAVQSGFSQGHHPGLGETGDRDRESKFWLLEFLHYKHRPF